MRYKRFKHDALGRMCRDCINEQYGISLKRKECLYLIYPSPCGCCGEVRGLVMDIAPRSRWKILLSRKRDT